MELKKSKRTIKEIIVHCTATKEGRETTVEEVTQWHKANGWDTIGYHYMVYIDGSIHEGRDVDKKGAHCYGHNSRSIGVCYVGGLDEYGKSKDTRTEEQKTALVELLTKLRALYPKAKIYGHRDFAAKDCPCFDAKTEYQNI